MSTVREQIDVSVPVRTAYDQWTQFEDFPHFMEGVEKVIQHDDTQLTWVAEIGGKHSEWEAKILEQKPDQFIKWASIEGAKNDGAVFFETLGDNQTRIALEMTYEPETTMNKIGDVLGVTKKRVKGDLERFKSFIESRGTTTGAWRGEVQQGQPRR